MQFKTTVFENKNQLVEGKTYGVLTIEQRVTVICDECSFSLTGTKEEIENSGFLLSSDLTLCDECSFQ